LKTVTDGEITTIGSSAASDSVTARTLLIIIDLSTTRADIEQVIHDMFSSICETLKLFVSPFAALFERSDARAVESSRHSKYESFVLMHELSDRVPSLRLLRDDADC
jgi:hypothetical protein